MWVFPIVLPLTLTPVASVATAGPTAPGKVSVMSPRPPEHLFVNVSLAFFLNFFCREPQALYTRVPAVSPVAQ